MTDPVVIRGGGEMATGVAFMLHNAGYRVAITEVAMPRAIRRTVAFAQAVYDGHCRVEHIEARRVTTKELTECWAGGSIPVLVDPDATIRDAHHFPVLVDALMSKSNAGGTSSEMADLVIGLGPGLTAPRDCHLVVETLRGHHLGRFYDTGAAIADTGEPGEIAGETSGRVLRSPKAGLVEPLAIIGQQVTIGMPIASVAGCEVLATLDGIVRGVMAAGCEARVGEKIADIDPRGLSDYCFLVSEKARTIGAGVRAAIDWWTAGRPYPAGRRPRNA